MSAGASEEPEGEGVRHDGGSAGDEPAPGAPGGAGADEWDEPQDGAGDAPSRRASANRRASVMLAAGMFAIDELLGRRPREEAPIVVDANGQPVDIDTDGIEVHVALGDGEEVAVAAPALPRSRPAGATAAQRSRRRRRRVV